MDDYRGGQSPTQADGAGPDYSAGAGATQERPAQQAYQQASYQQGYQAQEGGPSQGAPQEGASHAALTRKKERRGLKAGLAGLVGGVVGALAVALALWGAGLIGSPAASSSPTSAQTGSSGSNGTIEINASTEDADVAEAVAAKALPSVVSVYCTYDDGSGMGSGVILDTDGDIITNYHVINGASAISVTIDGKSYDASLVGSDSSSDIAVIKADLEGASVTPIEVGDSDQLAVGQWVMTVGSPFGLEQSVSQGIVSSLYRNELMTSSSGETIYTNLIQVDAAINPGNSGGALVNDQGQLVGICTLYSSDTESFAGIGFAIPGNYAVSIAKTIISGEPVTHAYIGLSMQTVNATNAAANGLSVNQGAYVAQVFADSPAQEAGIEAGDIVVEFDGQEITSADGMILAVRSHEIGDTVDVVVVRNDERKTLTVTLGSDETLQTLQSEQTSQGGGLSNPTGQQPEASPHSEDGYGIQDYLERIYEEMMGQETGGTNGQGQGQGGLGN